MKIAFFGTPPFTTAFLDALQASGYTPSLIVTNPDRASGRGMTIQSPAPKTWADEHRITVLQPEKLDDAFFETLSKESWDLFVVIAYGKIMPEKVIDLPTYSTINVHYSLLPKYRGATPVESAILHGDEATGIAIQKMRYKLDTGPIYVRSELDIEPTDTTPILREKLNAEALKLLVPTISGIFKGSLIPVEQSEDGASHCTKIKKEDGELNLADAPEINDRKYRAYYGSIGTYFYAEKNSVKIRVKIKKAKLENNVFVFEEVIPENGKLLSEVEFRQWLKA